MIRFVTLFAILIIPACATHKLEFHPDPVFDKFLEIAASGGNFEARLTIEKTSGQFPGGFQCFEPLLFFITLGIVPVHCVEEYRATVASEAESGEQAQIREYTSTTVAGWLALILMPFPSWKYGYGDDAADEIERLIKDKVE